VKRGLALPAALLLAASPVAGQVAAPYVWKNVTVGGGGFAPGIVFSPAAKGLAYLRTDMGGAYRWEARKRAWLPLMDGFAQGSWFGVESIAPDPVRPDRVYAAVGMRWRSPAAILRSDDRGRHWRVVEVPFRMGGNENGRGLGERLAVDPHRPAVLLFGSRHDGLWRSDDAGLHWRRDPAFPYAGAGPPRERESHGGIAFVLFDRNSRRAFAGIADPGAAGLMRSDDGGRSWSPVAGGPEGLLPVKAALGGDGRLWVSYANGIGPSGVTRGAVWALERDGRFHDVTPDRRSDAPPGGYIGITADPRRGGVAYVSTFNRWQPGDTIWRTRDGGAHWQDLGPLSRRDTRATPFLKWGREEAEFGHWIAGLALDPFDPSRLAYSTGATLYLTGDAGAGALRWMPWVKGIEQTAVITLVSPTGGAHLVSGFGDLGGFVHADLGRSPETMYLNPRHSNTNTLDYAGRAPRLLVRSGNVHAGQPIEAGLGWSADGGRSWNPLRTPFWSEGNSLEANGRAPVSISADGATFHVGAERPLLTRDRGRHWQEVTGLPGNLRVVTDKLDPRRAWAVDFEGRRRIGTRDGGASFAHLPARGLCPDLSVTRPRSRESQPALLASPFASGDLFLNCGGALYRSRDGGESFTRIAADLDVHLFGLGRGRAGPEPSLFAIGRRAGLNAVWRSLDGGTGWTRINDDAHQWGNRFRAISGDPRLSGRVYIATDGRGIVYGDPR
jgi:hypothetical protein